MPRRPTRLDELKATADAQLGLITAQQLEELGYPRSTTARRVAGGMWTRVLPGVYLVGGGRPVREQLILAALLYAGPGSMLTGTADLRLRGFASVSHDPDAHPDNPEPVHVLIQHSRRRKSTGYARIERTLRMPRPERIRGLVVAPAARAVADAARRMTNGRNVLQVVTEAVQRGFATVAELRIELDDGQMRGSHYLREAVHAVAEGAQSPPEADLLAMLTEAAVPHMMANVAIVDPHGRLIAVPDVWLDDVGLALEVDSEQYHSVGEGHARTVRRNARYARAGVPAFTVLPADLRTRPGAVIRDVLAARATAAGRPRPDVRVAPSDQVREQSAGEPLWRWGA
jgi:hypothetical protein